MLLTIVVTLQAYAAEEPIPDLGSRTADGFLVKCYWVGTFESQEKLNEQGVIDLFGQLSSPLNYKQTTTASIIITEEVDERGNLRAVVRGGSWSSKVTGLNYWRRTGQRLAGGNGGSGSGNIPTSGEAAPLVSIERGANTAGIHLSWSESDPLAFDVDYRDLDLKMNRQKIEDSIVVGQEVKKKRWKAKVMGMMATEEPVQPLGRNTVIRQEWNHRTFSPHHGGVASDWSARWIMTRVCQSAKLKLITPRGDPRTAPCDSGDGQNEFTFDKNSPGKLVINFKASVTPASALSAVKDRVSFSIDPIGDSKMEWDPSNPNGKATVSGGFLIAKATFTGLPSKNDDFGPKAVKLLLDGQLYEKTLVEIFFSKLNEDGRPLVANHPGGVASDPNWFYYWKEGAVCGIAPGDKFAQTERPGLVAYAAPTIDSDVRLCERAAMDNRGPITFTGVGTWGSVTGTGDGKGIKKVAEALEHERHHIAIWRTMEAGLARGIRDSDRDHVLDGSERSLDGVSSDPANPDTFNVDLQILDYAAYGDDEVRCRKKELSLTVPYDQKKDWANPGCQSKEVYGP